MNKSIFIFIFILLLVLPLGVHSQVSQIIKGPDVDKVDTTPQVSISPDSDKSSGQRVNYVSQSGDPVIIKKTINPISEDKYSIDSPLCISVEIKNNKNDRNAPDLKDIYIYEIIDNDLSLIDFSLYCDINSDLSKISDYKLDLFRYDIENPNIEKCEQNKNKCKYIQLYKKNDVKLENVPTEIYILNLNNISDYPPFLNDDDKKLLGFLKLNYGITWAENEAKGNNSINITKKQILENGRNTSLDNIKNELDQHKTILEIYDGRTYELKVKNKNGTQELFDNNNIIKVHAEKVSPKEYILFKYYIMPKRYGIFNTETIIRTYDTKYLYRPDMEYPLNIEIKDPKPDFEVRSSRNKHEAYTNDNIYVVYYITYLGGASEPIYNHASIKLDICGQSNFNYFDEHGRQMDASEMKSYLSNYTSFTKGYTREIPIIISYPKSGIYALPGIWINGIHYTFEDERTTVQTKFEKNKDLLSGLVLVIIIFIASKLIDIWKYCFAKKFHKDHPDRIKNSLVILLFILIFISIIIVLWLYL